MDEWWENSQEPLYLMVKTNGFRLKMSLQPIHWHSKWLNYHKPIRSQGILHERPITKEPLIARRTSRLAVPGATSNRPPFWCPRQKMWAPNCYVLWLWFDMWTCIYIADNYTSWYIIIHVCIHIYILIYTWLSQIAPQTNLQTRGPHCKLRHDDEFCCHPFWGRTCFFSFRSTIGTLHDEWVQSVIAFDISGYK